MSAEGQSGNSAPSKTRLIVADATPTYREGLKVLLSRDKHIEVVGLAGDGEEAIRLATELVPDIVLLAIELPKIDGIEVTRRIRGAHLPCAVVLLTSSHSPMHILEAMRAPVDGYLLKDISPEHLIQAVKLSHGRQECVIDYSVISTFWILVIEHVRKLMQSHEPASLENMGDVGGSFTVTRSPVQLGKREIEVLKLVGRGMGNKAIAASLEISERTVQNHLHNIYGKMGTSSRADAVLQAIKKGWISLDAIP